MSKWLDDSRICVYYTHDGKQPGDYPPASGGWVGSRADERRSPSVQASGKVGIGDRAASEEGYANRHATQHLPAGRVELEVIMRYPIVVHKDRKSDYGATVPDLPGCFSAGSTMDEALAMAREAIELHLEGLIEEELPIPAPTSIERHRRNADYAGGIWAVVDIDPANLRTRAKRVNVTLPEHLLDSIDRFAARHGETRSGLLVKAATTYIAAKPPPRRRRSA